MKLLMICLTLGLAGCCDQTFTTSYTPEECKERCTKLCGSRASITAMQCNTNSLIQNRCVCVDKTSYQF
jgi:hypothetical protein